MDKAKQIFLDALEVARPERTAYIERACAADVILRRRVDSLILAHDRADRMIVEPTVHPWNLDEHGPTAARVELPGTVIGPYTIEGVLGEGGFGTVYLARQEEPVHRRVALKLLRPGMDTRDVIARFEQERQALALMDHPGIAKVYDAGTTPAGRPYFAMEYVAGKSINDFADSHQLTIRQRLELMCIVCMAVQHAHAKGVVHRDLKPSNVLVTNLDGKPFPTIIDFGIAKAVQSLPGTAAISLTLPQQIIGTPQYMAPEQATLFAVDVDTRADVYSLGGMLYELLCGEPMFDAAKLKHIRPSELERLICDVDPPRPSVRIADSPRRDEIATARVVDPGRLPRLLQGDLDWICMRALEKDRGRRYATALALADDIRRFLSDQPVDASPPTPTYRLAKFARRHRIEFVAGATIAVALLAFALGSAWFALREYRAARAAEVQLARANALSKFSQDLLSGIDPAEARGMDTALLRKILVNSVQRVEEKLADEPEAAASMLNAIGYAYLQIADYAEAERLMRLALQRFAQPLGDDHEMMLQASQNLAAVLIETRRFDEADTILQRVVAARKRILGEEHSDTIVSMNNYGVLQLERGRLTEARDIFQRLCDIRERKYGINHQETLTSLNNLANVLDDMGDAPRAAEILERVLAGQRARSGTDHPKTLLTMNNLASAYRELGRSAESVKLYEDVLAIKKRVQGPEHPSTIVGMMNLAAVYTDQGKLDQAEALYTEAVKLLEKTNGAGDARVAAVNGLALIAKNRGRLDLAEPLADQALETARKWMGPKHPAVVTLLGNLGSLQVQAKEFVKAEQTAREAVALAEETVGPAHPMNANPRRLLARALNGQNRPAEAAAALAAAAETINPVSTDLRRAMAAEIAKYYSLAGDEASAAAWRDKIPATAPASTSPAN